jgi:hypothetical protein
MQMTDPKFVTVEQAAQHLSVSRSLMLRMVRDGRLVGYVDLAQADAKVRPVGPIKSLGRR